MGSTVVCTRHFSGKLKGRLEDRGDRSRWLLLMKRNETVYPFFGCAELNSLDGYVKRNLNGIR